MGYTRFTCGRKPSFGGGFGWAELTQVYSLGRRLTLVGMDGNACRLNLVA